MIRLAVKVGLAAGAVYYVKEQGVWKDSNESVKTYESIKTAVKPYVKKVTTQIPFELPEVPESTHLADRTKEYWNKAVIVSFEFIKEFPNYCSDWSQKGFDSALKNQEIKKFMDSFTSSEKPATLPEKSAEAKK